LSYNTLVHRRGRIPADPRWFERLLQHKKLLEFTGEVGQRLWLPNAMWPASRRRQFAVGSDRRRSNFA
jgi:hypothetical protein